MGAVETVWAGPWEYRGTLPVTGPGSETESYCGEIRVHRMTESAYGSPEATPWVKFRSEGRNCLSGVLRLLTLCRAIPRPGWCSDGER